MDDKRKKDLEDEMSRFESEISGNLPPPPKASHLQPPASNGFTPSSHARMPLIRPSSSNGFNAMRHTPPQPPRMPTFPTPPMPHMFPGMSPFGGIQSGSGIIPPGMIPPPMMVPPMMAPMMIPPSVSHAPVMPGTVQPPTVTLGNETAASTSSKKNKSKSTVKKKAVVRVAGGEVWEDSTLLEWDPNDFRIFVGDLGNEVSDDALLRAFSKYPSLLRAKIVRDRKTKKTKGFGFVSFKDPQDYLKAMREMNGKYVGNRPIKLRKSTWKDRNIGQSKKKDKEKKKLGIR